MPHPSRHDIGAYLQPPSGVTAQSLIVAASGTDNIETNGAGVNRTGFRSAIVHVCAEAVLTAAEDLDCKITVQHSVDDTVWADAGAAHQPAGGANTSLLLLAGGAGGTFEGVARLAIDIDGLNEFIRVQLQPDMTAGATDTAAAIAFLELGGADVLPAA